MKRPQWRLARCAEHQLSADVMDRLVLGSKIRDAALAYENWMEDQQPL